MNLDRFQPAKSKLEKGKIEVVVGEASSTRTSIPTHITTEGRSTILKIK